jgi:hypothetical protein
MQNKIYKEFHYIVFFGHFLMPQFVPNLSAWLTVVYIAIIVSYKQLLPVVKFKEHPVYFWLNNGGVHGRGRVDSPAP